MLQTESMGQRIAVTEPRVDVVSGEGLDEALAGAETIIDTATGPSSDQDEATAFFTASARNLQRAGDAAGVKRIVVVSIIGIDNFPQLVVAETLADAAEEPEIENGRITEVAGPRDERAI